MIQRILTALDYDDTCQGVFEQALDLAQATQSELKLLNVLALERDSSVMFSPYTDMDWGEYEDQYRRLQTDSLKLLEGFAEKAKAVKISTDFAQEVGMAGPVICKLGKMWKADLIVVGSHGRKGLSEMLLGSVSNYVVHHATCSVMVVHKPT